MPCPAAVTTATLPCSLLAIRFLPRAFSEIGFEHVNDGAVGHLLDALDAVSMAAVPRDVPGQHLAGVETDRLAAELAGALLGGLQEPAANAGSLRGGACRHAPDQKVAGPGLEDQRARETRGPVGQ